MPESPIDNFWLHEAGRMPGPSSMPAANSPARKKNLLDPYHSIASSLFNGGNANEVFLAAARDGDYEKIESLLLRRNEALVSIDVRDQNTGNTPIIWAAKRGHVKIVQLLLKHSADITLRNYEGQTALEVASPQIRSVLLESVEKGGSHRNLLQAAWQGNANLVKKILAENRAVDINCRNADGLTPLLLVTRDVQLFEKLGDRINRGYKPDQVVQELLAHRADPNAVDNEGKTPLHYVSSSKAKQAKALVEKLLQDGSDYNAQDRRCFTPIHHASQSGNVDVVLALLDGGSDANARGFAGATPLHISAINGHDEVAGALLNNGGDVTLVDDSGLTPVEVAKTKKVKATLKNAWTEVVRSRSETSLGPVRTPSVSSIRRSQEFESPLNIIKKKKGGEVIFDETEEIFELELAGSPSSTLTGAVQRLDAVMKNSGVLQSVSLPSPSNAVESMTPRKVAMIAQLTHAEKALKAEEQMLKDLSEGRFTPNKYQNIFLSRETTRLLGNSRSSSSSASRRTPQPPRTPRGVSLSPIKSVTTPRKKGSGKKEIKFGPGTKMEDGNKARTGSACNKHSTVERTASDPSKGPAGMKECQIPVTILGLDLDDNLQEIRVKRIVQGPIGHVLQKKGHVRQHSDPLPPDMFTVNEDLLRGRSSSKSSVLSNSDDWEEINARHHSPTRTPSGDKSRHFNLDTIEEGKVSKKQPLILDLDQMQLTNHPRTPIMGDSNLYTYPASKKLLPATPTYRSQEFGDSMKLVDMSAEFAMSDSTSSTDSSDKSDEEEEDDDDDDEDEEEDDEEEESGSESSEDEVRIALPNPTDLLRSKSILKQHFNIEESRVHLSEDKTKTRQSNRSSTSSGLGTEASSSSSSNRSSMASSVGASASADTSPTPASESQVLCNGPVDGVISQVITGPDNKQTRGQATSKTTSNINKKNCGGVAAKAKLSNAEAAAKLQTAAKQNAVNACKSSQSSKVGTNTQQQAAKSSANANKITVHNTLLDTENKSTKVQESKTTGSAASQNKTPATTPKVNGTITSNHQGLKTSNSNSQPLSTAGKDNKHFQSGSSQLAQETLVKTSVAPKAGNQASVSAKPAACQGTLNVDATQERKPCQQKPTVKTPQYAPNQTPQNKTVSAGAKATTAGTGSKPAEGPKPSEQAKVSIVKSATSTPQTTASAASVTKSTPNITSSGSEKPMSTSPMRNSAPVSSTNKSEVSAAKTPQVSSSAPTNQPSQPNSVAKPSHKVVPEPVGQVVKPSTVAKPVGVQHLQVQAAKLHDSPNHSNSGTPQGSPAPARKPGSNSTTRCQAGGSHSPVHSTGKTGDLKYSGSISSAKIISERPSSAKNKGAAVGGRPLSGKSAGRPASGKKHKIQGGNINVDKVLEHTPKICDPFETIKAQQSMEAAASQEQSIAGANTSRAQNRCGGKNRQALVPSKNYSLKDKHQEPRQTSGNRKRGSKSKEVKTNNSNSQAQVKIKRPKSGKRCRSKKKRKGGKDKDIEFNEADPSKVAYISGIGWSVKTNCNERGDDVHAVQVAIDTDDSSDSEDDITLMADKSDASRSSRSRGSKAPRHAFNQDSTDDTCTDEEVEDLADAEVVHDEVIFLQPAAVREQMAKEEKEEKNSSSGKKLEHGGDREKVWAAEMNARAVSPTTNMPSLIPRTISAIEAFSKAVTDDQLNDMLESGAATPVNTGYTLPNEVEKDVKAQAKISSATTHAAKPVPAGGKPKPQVAPKPAKGAGGQTGATQSNRNSATTKPANQTAKPVSKAVTQGTKPITKTQAQPTQPGGRAPSQAQAKPKLTTQTSQPGSSTQGPKTQAPSTQSVSKGLQRQTSLTKAPPRPPPPASKIPTSPAKAPNQATRPASHVTNQSQPSPTKTAATSQPAAKASPQLNTKVPPPRPPPPAKPTIKPESVTTDTRGKDASPQFQNTKESMKGSEKKPEVSDQQQACVKGSSAVQPTNHSSQSGAQGQVKNETEKKSLMMNNNGQGLM